MLIDYLGVWGGPAIQDENGKFKIIVSLAGGRPDHPVGMVYYYDFQGIPGVGNARIVATLELETISNDGIKLKEKFLIEGQGLPSEMTLKLLPCGELQYTFETVGQTHTGGGTLRRL